MGLKEKIKKMFVQKEYIPIFHQVPSSKEFEEKVVLISGGSGGIGLAIAKSLQEAGAIVVISGTNENKLNKIKEETNLETIVMNYSKP